LHLGNLIVQKDGENIFIPTSYEFSLLAMLTRKFFPPFSIVLILAAVLLNANLLKPFAWSTSAAQLNAPLVAVIVDSNVYKGIQFSLEQYGEDVNKSGFALIITQTNQLVNGTREAVKEYLQGLLTPNLVGALLIGDVPEAWYRVGSNRFPTDVYYMDLNGRWVDTDGDGILDKHDGKAAPEIWVGRLKVSTVNGDTVSLLNNYFGKNHRYRNGMISIPWWRALLYMDDQGVIQGHDGLTPLKYIASDVTSVTAGYVTNATDYKLRLLDKVGYHWLYLMCHGTATNHTFVIPSKESFFQWDGTVYSSDYQTLDPNVLFYQLFVCSAGRYTEPDYTAGSAVFGNTHGLFAMASTDDTFTFPFNGFYKSLSEGKNIGTAFLQWLKAAFAQRGQSGATQFDVVSYEVLLHDTVLIGDPTLQLYRENHEIALTGLAASSKNVSNTEIFEITFMVENRGNFTETFNVSVLFDSEILYQNQLTLAAKKNQTIMFSPADSSKYLWSNYIYHEIDAQISNLTGEFNVNDNFQRVNFRGHVILSWTPGHIPEVLFAVAGVLIFGVGSLKFLNVLMSERPFYRLRMGIVKIRVYVNRVLSKQRVN